jgi:hypothetical protein
MLIHQFSPYSCSLDCLTHFLRGLGYDITTQDILIHHKDICWNNPAEHYGAIDKNRFKVLVTRYLFTCNELVTPTTEQLKEIIIKDKEGVFVFSEAYNGTDGHRHVGRLIGISGDELDVLFPGFPYGNRICATISKITDEFKSAFIHVKPLVQ